MLLLFSPFLKFSQCSLAVVTLWIFVFFYPNNFLQFNINKFSTIFFLNLFILPFFRCVCSHLLLLKNSMSVMDDWMSVCLCVLHFIFISVYIIIYIFILLKFQFFSSLFVNSFFDYYFFFFVFLILITFLHSFLYFRRFFFCVVVFCFAKANIFCVLLFFLNIFIWIFRFVRYIFSVQQYITSSLSKIYPCILRCFAYFSLDSCVHVNNISLNSRIWVCASVVDACV